MNKLLDFIERHKIGILITIAVHLALFLYFQIATIKEAVIYEPWSFTSEKAQDNIEVTPDQIQTNEEQDLFNSSEEVTSFVKNENDDRERSLDKNMDYTSYSKGGNPEQMEKDFEKQLKDDIQKSKGDQEDKVDKSSADIENEKNKPDPQTNTGGGASSKAVAGATMVSYSLNNRHPLNHNDWNIRNPGYTCGNVNGVVKIAIVVDNGGIVVKADVVSSQNANACMVNRAKEYALMSRFNYSPDASQRQEGMITYRFVYKE